MLEHRPKTVEDADRLTTSWGWPDVQWLATDKEQFFREALSAAAEEIEALRADLRRLPEFAHFGGTGGPLTPEGQAALDAVARLLNERDRHRGALHRICFGADVDTLSRAIEVAWEQLRPAGSTP